MKLDISCVRNILLTVEKNENFLKPVTFENFNFAYYDDYLSTYSMDEILYHVQYCIKAGLLYDVSGNGHRFKTSFDCCMNPSGHDFLANVRTEENWSKTKAILSKLGDASLKVISATAEGVATAFMNKYLREELSHVLDQDTF